MQPSLPSSFQGSKHTPAGLGALSGVRLSNLVPTKTVMSQDAAAAAVTGRAVQPAQL
jgi:hypothetical protein